MKKLLVLVMFLTLFGNCIAQVQLGKSLWKDSTASGTTYFLLTNRPFANSWDNWIFPRYFHSSIAGDGLSLGSSNELQLNVDASTGIQLVYDTLRWVGISTIDVDDSTIYKNVFNKYAVKYQESFGLTKDDGGLKIKLATNSGLTFNPSESYSVTLDVDSGLAIEGNKVKVKLSDELGFDGSKRLEIKSIDASKIDVATLAPTLKLESQLLTIQYDTLTIRQDSVNSYLSAKTRTFLFWTDSAGGGTAQTRYLTRAPGTILDTVGYVMGRGGYIVGVVSVNGESESNVAEIEPIRFESNTRINLFWDQAVNGVYVRLNSIDASTAIPAPFFPPINTIHVEVVLDN